MPRSRPEGATRRILVWELPLRLWHWLLVLTLATSLATGLSGGLTTMEWHLRSGYVVLGLVLFRLAWLVWGGRYTRLPHYLRPGRSKAHTAPGAAMALFVLVAVALQAMAGLFSSDDIFTEGPFTGYVSDDTVDLATSVHVRLFWVIIAAATVHVLALAYYGFVRRDALALSMFSGRKTLDGAPTPGYVLRGLATAGAAALAVWGLLRCF